MVRAKGKNLIRKTPGDIAFDVIIVVIMVGLMVVTIYPFVYVLFASVSDAAPLLQHRGILWKPIGFTLQAYKLVFQNPMILIGYGNTIFYVVVGTVLNVFLTTLGAYALSRKKVMWKKPIMLAIVFTMFFSGGLVPRYLLVHDLGLLDTRWALILPTAVSAWNLIIMRTAFQGIPESLEESARIDGANDFTILFRIVFPLSLPVIAVITLFYAVYHWNSYFDAMIFIRNRDLYPLQLVLREILVQNDTNNFTNAASMVGDQYKIGQTIKYAIIIVSTVPILFLYPFLQRYFVKGVMIGSLKE